MMSSVNKYKIILRPNNPDFLDLPWGMPLAEWEKTCARVEQVPKGLSFHPVIFVNYDGSLYALKEMPRGSALREYNNLLEMEKQHIPAVTPSGYVELKDKHNDSSILITKYLERSIPYRSLFMSTSLKGLHDLLLNAVAGLLVQLHLSGFFWGDCSLSNTLFRRDTGALQAYLVDAENSEIENAPLSPALRQSDLLTMESNISSDLTKIAAAGSLPDGFSVYASGAYISQRYQSLWEMVNQEVMIHTNERYRIQDQIKALNNLGFTVRDVSITPANDQEKLRFRIFVAERNFYRNQLIELIGLQAEEMQARKLINEIQEIKAVLSNQRNQNISLNAAAYHWEQNVYRPVIDQLSSLIVHRREECFEEQPDLATDPVELYCQILEHKWYLSEREHRDVGHHYTVQDYLRNVAKDLHLPPA